MPKKGEYKYTYEELTKMASGYDDKAEFRKKHHRAYERLKKEGLLDELFDDKDS